MTAVPFPRQFGPGASGGDCRAVKRALAAALKSRSGMNLRTNGFGGAAQQALKTFKHKHGLLADPVYTQQAHGKLERDFDAFGRALMETAYVYWQQQRARDAFCAVADLTVTHKRLFRYSELIGDRPGERGWWRVAPLRWDGSIDYSCDCSQHYIGCGHHAGLGSPLFSSDGNTGTILGYPRTTAGQAERGDAVVFVGAGWPGGHHVTILREKLAGGDWRVVNMGGPADPSSSTLSAQAEAQRAFGAPTAVYVRLPA